MSQNPCCVCLLRYLVNVDSFILISIYVRDLFFGKGKKFIRKVSGPNHNIREQQLEKLEFQLLRLCLVERFEERFGRRKEKGM